MLLTQNAGRVIENNAELARIQIKQSALDNEGNLKPWIKEVLLAVKENQK